MSGSLIDSNVLLDIATEDAKWMTWSQTAVLAASARGPIFVNPIIYAEIAPTFASVDELNRFLDPALFNRAVLPYEAG